MVREWRAALLSKGVSSRRPPRLTACSRALLMTAADDRSSRATRAASAERDGEASGAAGADCGPGLRAGRSDEGSPGSAPWCCSSPSPACDGAKRSPAPCDVDLDGRTVSVRRHYIELTGQLILGPPKSRPASAQSASPGPSSRSSRSTSTSMSVGMSSLVFTGPRGGILRRGNFRRGQAGRVQPARSVFLACTSMICGTQATCSPHQAPAWAT